MAEYTQDGRPFRLETPLGADVLLLQGFVGDEATSRPFLYTLELLSESGTVAAADLLGKEVSVVIALEAGGERTIRGVVRQFARLGGRDKLYAYRAEIVPWLWLATLRSDIRTFQGKTVPEIVQAVLKPHSTHVQLSLTGTYPPREYCVQYAESDFAFVSRLMEEEGIYYFFTHTATALTMTLADAPSALKTAWQTSADVREGDPNLADTVFAITEESAVRSDKVTVSSYDFEQPSTSKLHSEVTPKQPFNLEQYEMIAAYDTPSATGKRQASLRLDAHEATALVVRGASTAHGLQAGAKITFKGAPTPATGAELHLLSVHHEANNGDYVASAGAVATYRNAFVAVPASAKYRPPRETPRPRAHGVQTAVVVGPKGEEIYVDKYGRVKVQFRWDRLGASDDTSSAWVRVSSAWAGKGWGFLAHPRIGQEVLVEFVDGDPDQPVVTGRVYNAESMMPYASDKSTTQTGIKSRSSAKGGESDFNELRFDDKKGEEHVSFQAQKDLIALVKNDETRDVGHDRTTTIKNDDTRTVTEGDDSLEVTAGDRTVLVKAGKQTVTVHGDDATTVEKGAQTVEVQEGARTVTVAKGAYDTKVAKGDYTVVTSSGKQTFDAPSGGLELKCGANTIVIGPSGITLKVGANAIEMSASGITVKVAPSKVEVTPSGVKIAGMQVAMEGTMTAEVKGLKASLEGSAMTMVKGGITMIN